MAIIIPESLEQNNHRQDVRVQLSPKDPVRLAADRQKVYIDNLSMSGVAFTAEQPIDGKRIRGVLKFRMDQVYTMSLTLEVMRQKGDYYHVKFVGMEESDQKLISRLIVAVQKLHIRRKQAEQKAAKQKQVEEMLEEKRDGETKLEFNFSKKGKAQAKKAKKDE